MAMKCSSNLRVGKTYGLSIDGKEAVYAIVEAKGNRKLQLKIGDNVEWFSTDRLTSAKVPKAATVKEVKQELKPVVKVEKVVVVQKPVVKVEPVKVVATPKIVGTPEIFNVRTSTVKIEPKIAIKSDEKLLTSSVDFEKELNDESINDYKYLARCLKKDIRVILKQKGYQNIHTITKETPVRELLGILQRYLPMAQGGKK